MQNKITFKKNGKSFTGLFILFFIALHSFSTNAQVVSTSGGVNYLGNFSINNPAPLAISFVIENTGATPLALTNVSTQLAPYFGVAAGTPSAIKLFTSTTSLSGIFDISTPAWTQQGTGNVAVPAALAVTPVLSGLYVVIPPTSQMRFVLEATKGLAFSFTPTPTPNFFTVGAATLKLGTALIAGSAVGYAAVSPLAPAGNAGAFFGGTVTLIPAVACTGTPAPGNTIASLPTVCATLPIALSLQNPTPGSGVTYQWRTGPSAIGPWTNVTGGTNSSLSTSLTASTFYQCLVTCSGNTGTSTPVQVLLTPVTACYCASGATDPADEDILNVTIGTLNNTSTCATLAPGLGSILNRYSNYTSGVGAPAAGDLLRGVANPFSLQIGTCGGNFSNSSAIWIDFDQSGSFEPSERVYFTPAGITGPHFETGNILIPATALTGLTRMRVSVIEFGTPATLLPCASYAWGETEDYNVNIVTCASVGITTQPTNVTAACGTNVTIRIVTAGPGFSYQWQYRVSATSPWLTVVNNATYSGATSSNLVVSDLTPTLNGYQYRVIYSNPCFATDFSSVATLTVGPFVVTTSPTSAVICQAGGIQQLTISNAPTLLSGSVTVNSTFTTPKAIPDAPAGSTLPYPAVVLAGIKDTLAVSASGIPAGATITGVSVRVSGTHPFFGDLVMSLKAPNTNTVNLDYFLNATGGGVSTAFTNTVITSNTSAAPLSTGTPAGLYTGTYRADLVTAAGLATFGNQPAGPTGLLPNGVSFLPLYTPTNIPATVAGNWILGIYDGGATDAGSLSNWSITINYTYLGFPVGVFTGAAGTIFTDALATIPYTGTAVNSVYVKPTTSSVYTTTVTLASGCVGSASIPVTVNRPVAGTATLDNKSLCANKNTSFALGGALTGGPTFNHQFQVKTSATAAWADVINGGVYSGATTTTLTLTNVPFTFNGYQFRDSISSLGCGFLLSTVGTLTVSPNTNPQVVISAAPVTKLFPSLTSTLTAAVSSATAPLTYQWFRNGTAVTGATTNRTVVNIDGLGVYTVSVLDANGCTSAAGASTPASIAITDSVTTDRLFIYPSPNSGQFQVRWYTDLSSGSLVPGLLNIYDSKGSRVFTGVYTVGNGYKAMNVDLGVHGKGVYRVDLLDFNGNRLKTGSVMVF
jgi:subtilisin-like proprotein convertase family protein